MWHVGRGTSPCNSPDFRVAVFTRGSRRRPVKLPVAIREPSTRTFILPLRSSLLPSKGIATAHPDLENIASLIRMSSEGHEPPIRRRSRGKQRRDEASRGNFIRQGATAAIKAAPPGKTNRNLSTSRGEAPGISTPPAAGRRREGNPMG